MANKFWKKLEKSDAFRNLKVKIRRLTGTEPSFITDVEVDIARSSGWNYIPSLINQNDIIYSFGVCDDIDFEVDMINNRKASVHAFDPTPYSVRWIDTKTLPKLFSFYP